MNIHRYEKLWLVAALVLIVGFIATITYGSVGLGIAMIDDEAETVNPEKLNEHEDFGEPGVKQVGENEYEVYIRAWQFGFDPGSVEAGLDPIEVPANSTVTLYITSEDVIHSFSVVGTNINTMAIPGEVSSVTVEFDEPGEYGILCAEYCGAGHHTMEGKIIVHPEDEYAINGTDVETGNDTTDETEA